MTLKFRTELLFISLFYFCSFAICLKESGGTLYVASDNNQKDNQLKIINRVESDYSELHKRSKRDVSTPLVHKNISTWTTHLNDSHQQLMVHWVGEGSEVIICLARDSIQSKGSFTPSAVYISYDYGKNFTNKTESFTLSDAKNSSYAQLDKFYNHPRYPEFCVFVDSLNKKIFYTTNNGVNISRTDLDFHPSELAFDEEFPNRFVILDKVNYNKTLYLTQDGGKTFRLVQSFVKSFYWASGIKHQKWFFVERYKPGLTSTVFVGDDPLDLIGSPTMIFEDAKDFQIKGDYMFVTKQTNGNKTLELYISHLRGPFYKCEFQTELDLKKFHIADVTNNRIFVSVMHTENLANLYVSEINRNFTQYNFVLSLEQILCYFPDGNWKDSWLEDVTEDPFTDLYRVEGMKGIYIASKVESKSVVLNISPEHVISVITFDHGNTWSPINSPTEDEHGNPMNCHIENSCSLHLCQKFSQLYPVTRSANIMSSKAAPGVIMATGVMGKSLKGIPGLFMSRDAGLTWKRILKDYYFFNYGDHGGVLIAVKYFKSKGETRRIVYSTNEGIDWNAYEFHNDDLRIYGLMTEPGENTTTFTMFGSANEQHQWIIITIDLFNAFARNCTPSDYKFWSPSPPNTTVSCIMGTRDTFQRRIPQTNCYNGVNYDRPVKKEKCPCGRRDYECDYGFMLTGKDCIRNTSVKYDPYEMPKECPPGTYYTRTKGYRKIDGDVCVASSYVQYEPELIPCPLKSTPEFILVALRDKIGSIDLEDNSTIFPVTGQKNIVAIEYDMKNQCIYWADIELDKISRQCYGKGTTQEVIVGNYLSSIEGMALDWISNVLFFVDGLRRRIEAVRTDLVGEGRMRRTILDSKVLAKPRGIAVHPKAGYLFWTDWERPNPSVSRSNLDGTNIKKLFGHPIVEWPNGITIDYMSDRIYWVDAMEDYIASSDLNGQYLKRILANDRKVSHPFAIAVLKDKMYWDDWKAKSIFMADKDTGANIITLKNSFSGLMDLKVFAHFVQHGTNACSSKNNTCEAMCLGGPGNTYSCLCPDGFVMKDGKCMCLNGLAPLPNMTCPMKDGTCSPHEFTCKNGRCISESWRCDGNNDCGDNSDEFGCSQCAPPLISCDDGSKCYLERWKCDGEIDCADMSDEKDCGTRNCSSTQFSCDNGYCIEKRWLCDGDMDCKDGSDEKNCTYIREPGSIFPTNCSANGLFSCGLLGSSELCIPNAWVCDGELDCPNGEDEKDEKCNNSTCASYMFRCPNGKCIFKSWVCDGENDCGDEASSDEKNCTNNGHSKIIPRPTTESPLFPTNGSCLDWMFQCDNGKCIPFWWRCDNSDDCKDNSDEMRCPKKTTETSTSKSVMNKHCSKNQFTCSPGVCIPLKWVCDSMEDCINGEDERGCYKQSPPKPLLECGADETPCADQSHCIKASGICDGMLDCDDRSDERDCDPKVDCPSDYFLCDYGTQCISKLMVCDDHRDCRDNTDEENCSYELSNRFIYQSAVNSTSFLASYWMAQQNSVLYSYLPSISKVEDGIWKNMTWTNDSNYRFTDLEPFTNYNVTFYIRDSKSNKTYASNRYVNATTSEGVPSPPLKVSVRQGTGSRVSVLWDPPKYPRGVIQYYKLYYSPPLPPVEYKVTQNKVTISGFFKPNHNYTFWVTATNNAFTSESSEVMHLLFDELGDIDDLVNASLTRINDTAVHIVWHKVRGTAGYIVQVRPPRNYPQPKPIVTKDTQAYVTNLPTGTNIYIDIKAFKDTYVGEPFTLSIRTAGETDETLSVSAVLVKENRTSVLVTWDPPKGDRYKGKNLTYEVYYNNTFQHIISGTNFYEPMAKVTNTSTVVNNLTSCRAYIFAVCMTGGPLSRLIEVSTLENPREPVKKLIFAMNKETSELRILWEASCEIMSEPVAYRIDVAELTTGVNSTAILPPTKLNKLNHVFKNISEGARYYICVSTNLVGSVPKCSMFLAPSIPAPDNVVAWRAPNGHVVVDWNDAHTHNHTHTYQILISDKEIPLDTLGATEGIDIVTTKSSPYLVSGERDKVYVAVRAVSPHGYYSDMSEVYALDMQGSPEESTVNASVYWGAGLAVCVAVVAGVVAALLALRHRRLSRSLLRLTTPRYDSRRGHATIVPDDDDVPPIQGFSDDEPLVIA